MGLQDMAEYLEDSLEEVLDERDRLLAAIQRIDGINDNPAHYNSEINAVCDAILRPHLVKK